HVDLYISSHFFFNTTPTAAIYTLSLHDALPIYSTPNCCRGFGNFLSPARSGAGGRAAGAAAVEAAISQGCAAHIASGADSRGAADRKSTRLNSSHVKISYAVFCLKKKN